MKFWPLYQNSADNMTEEDIFKRYGHRLVIPIPQSLDGVIEYVATSTPLELANLDKKVRERSLYLPPEILWPQISAEEVKRILKTPGASVPLLGLVSFHHSGYIREFAVRRLSERNTGSELPFLLLRLNDWVDPVYQLALAAVQERITPQYAEALVRNISLEFELERQTRHEHGKVLTAITTLLKRQECDVALQQGLIAPDKTTRSLCFQVLVEADDARLPLSIPTKLADAHPAIRLSAARIARIMLKEDELRALLPTMRLDTFMPVRREALYACVERLPYLAPAALTTALLDPSAGIRGIARYHLRQSENSDISAFYRQVLTESVSASSLNVALSGLGETGTAADVSLILPYLAHPLAKVHRASVRAIAKLDGDNQIEALLAALTDEKPSVAHEAREALRSRLGFVDKETLQHLFQTQLHLHVKLDVLALLSALPKWDSLPFLVEAAIDEDSTLRAQAVKHLQAWFSRYNHSFTRPTTAQIERLAKALQINSDKEVAAIIVDWKAKGTI